MNHDNLDSQEYARFGQVSVKPLGDTRKLVAKSTSISWSQIPHVTHHDEVSIDSIQVLVSNHEEITLLSILVKAFCGTLNEFPELNASLSNDNDALIMKSFYNIGIAVDTEQGLLVPVVKAADRQTP